MGYGEIRGTGYAGSPHTGTLGDVCEEVLRAREKFPSNRHLLAALVEEVGELAQALLEGGNGERAREEAVQVACVAIRLIEEGDRDYAPRKVESE